MPWFLWLEKNAYKLLAETNDSYVGPSNVSIKHNKKDHPFQFTFSPDCSSANELTLAHIFNVSVKYPSWWQLEWIMQEIVSTEPLTNDLVQLQQCHLIQLIFKRSSKADLLIACPVINFLNWWQWYSQALYLIHFLYNGNKYPTSCMTPRCDGLWKSCYQNKQHFYPFAIQCIEERL